MATAVPMARTRGTLSGLALILLGAWGGLALLVGPYFDLGFAPDQPWHSTMARLYLSFIPGAVVLLCGLIVLVTRSRGFGGTAAVLAALGGAWFVIGGPVMIGLGAALSSSSVAQLGSVGSPLDFHGNGGSAAVLADFLGVGVLIVFFAALALGRFSIAAHKDHARYADLTAAGLAGGQGGGLDSVGFGSGSPRFDPYQPTETSPPPAPDAFVGGENRFPSQYPDQTPTTTGSSPPWPPATEVNNAGSGFTPGQVTYSAGQTRYPPGQEQTSSMTAPTEEHQFPDR